MAVLLYVAGLATGFFVARTALPAPTRRTIGLVVIVCAALVPVLALGAVALSAPRASAAPWTRSPTRTPRCPPTGPTD